MADNKPQRGRVRIDRSELVLEIVSIVIAIILATAAGQFVEHYRAGVRTHEALAQIRQEVANDDKILQAVRPLHRRVRVAFDTTVRRTHGEQLSFDALSATFFHAAPHGFRPFGGTTTAWELARGSNVLADVPYELRSLLQTRYAELDGLQGENAAFIGRLEGTPTGSQPNFFFTAVTLSLILSDVTYAEDRLVKDDAAVLRALGSAGIR